MCKWIKQTYWRIIPLQGRQFLRNSFVEIRHGRDIREELAKHIESAEGELRKEFEKINDRIRRNPITVYNYDFCDKYKIEDCIRQIKYDNEKRMYYAVWKGKRLYISRLYNTAQMAAVCLQNIYIEQDIESPHRYISENYPIPLAGGGFYLI